MINQTKEICRTAMEQNPEVVRFVREDLKDSLQDDVKDSENDLEDLD